MKSLFRDFLTGITFIIGAGLLIWMLLQFGELAELRQRFGNFSIKTSTASGISSVARVTHNGVSVGNVTALRNDPDGGVLVDVRIRDGVFIPEDFVAFVEPAFVGESTLDLRSASGESVAAIPARGEVYERKLLTLGDTLREELTGPQERFDEISEAVLRLADTYDQLGQEATTLTSDVRTSLAAFDSAAAETRTQMARVVDVIERTASSVDTRLLEFREAFEATNRSIDATLVSADRTLTEVRALAQQANQGRGTLGLLLHDDALYRNMLTITREMDKTLLELRLAVEKFRDEGVPLRF